MIDQLYSINILFLLKVIEFKLSCTTSMLFGNTKMGLNKSKNLKRLIVNSNY